MSTTLVIPTIPPRKAMAREAMASADAQTLSFDEIIVISDFDHQGPAVMRNKAVEHVKTEWICFLDDDDLLDPNHHEVLAALHGDVRWPWFRVKGGSDPFPMFRGRQWDPDDPHQIPITTMIRTEAFRAVGGFQTVPDGPTDQHGNRAGEDWRLWLDLSAAGYSFEHTPEITWTWRHHGGNTSGMPSRWK